MGLPLKDLDDAGLLLPREEWGKEDLHSYTSRAAVVLAWFIAAVSAVLMYIGNGHAMTWIGLAGMFCFLAWFTFISLRAITIRNADTPDIPTDYDDD